MKLRNIKNPKNCKDLDEKLQEIRCFRILIGKPGQYWCTIAFDHPDAVIVLSTSGGKSGLKTPRDAFEEALKLAIPRLPLLDKPEEWVKPSL